MPRKASESCTALVISAAAECDIEDILYWTSHAFGAVGRKRYEALIQNAFIALACDPNCLGTRPRDDIGKGIRSFHLSSSRKSTKTRPQVAKPRHLVFFQMTDGVVNVLRLLHDSMDFAQHLDITA